MRKLVFLTWDQIKLAVDDIAFQIKDLDIKGIYAIPRGGLCFGVMLSHKLGLPLRNSVGSKIIVVDDICDSGETIGPFLTLGFKVACLVNLSDKKICSSIKLPKNSWIVFPWENNDKATEDLKEYENKRNI